MKASALLLRRVNTLTLYSKSGHCSLCEEAKQSIKKVQKQVSPPDLNLLTEAKVQFDLEEVDISKPENSEFRKYQYDIPVLHFNGTFLMQHKVTEEVLLAKLLEKSS
jgi:hypothetical protein